MVQVVASKEEWDTLMANPDVTYIIDFTATWCGPCRMIGPVFEELAPKYSKLVFLKVDVDENSAVAEACGISAMPTFHVYRGGQKIDELVGASKDKLEALIQKNSA